jgi:hypothetical protein
MPDTDIDTKLKQGRRAMDRMRNAIEEQDYLDAASDLATCFDTIDYILKSGGPLPQEWSR